MASFCHTSLPLISQLVNNSPTFITLTIYRHGIQLTLPERVAWLIHYTVQLISSLSNWNQRGRWPIFYFVRFYRIPTWWILWWFLYSFMFNSGDRFIEKRFRFYSAEFSTQCAFNYSEVSCVGWMGDTFINFYFYN